MYEHVGANHIWLEVSNVRTNNTLAASVDALQVQLKGDRSEPEPLWWNVREGDWPKSDELRSLYRSMTEGLDKKRLVLARLSLEENPLALPALEKKAKAAAEKCEAAATSNAVAKAEAQEERIAADKAVNDEKAIKQAQRQPVWILLVTAIRVQNADSTVR